MRPFRDVEHIEERTGSRGGRYWLLTLSCGHIVTRDIPRFRIWKALDGQMPPTAPHRVQCRVCESVVRREQHEKAIGAGREVRTAGV